MKTRNSERKTLLSIVSNAEGARIQREIATIRGDAVQISEKIHPFESTELAEKLMRRKKCALFMNVTKEKHLVVGRTFNDEIIDMAEFRITACRLVGDFDCAGPELHAKYFVLLQNIGNERLENLVADLLNMRSMQVCLDNIRHAWVFAGMETGYTLKYVRVLKDFSIEDCGPCLEMELFRSYHCGDELYKTALDAPGKPKKNVQRNEFNDRVGRIHIDRQDLKDIRLRRTQSYKSDARRE